jgi:hypothetical protein
LTELQQQLIKSARRHDVEEAGEHAKAARQRIATVLVMGTPPLAGGRTAGA